MVLIKLPADYGILIALMLASSLVALLVRRKFVEKEEDEYKRRLKEKVFWFNFVYWLILMAAIFWVNQNLSTSCYGYCIVQVCPKYCWEIWTNSTLVINPSVNNSVP